MAYKCLKLSFISSFGMNLNELKSHEDLEKAFSEWGELFFRYVFVRLRNTKTAEDIAQEVFIKAWFNRDSFDAEKASLKTWMFAIATNLIRDYLRKEMRYPVDSLEEDTPEKNNFYEAISNDDELRYVFNKIFELSDRERELLFLRYREGMEIKEMAQILNLEYSATKVALHRALIKLRKICNEDSGDVTIA